jgi:cytochrome b
MTRLFLALAIVAFLAAILALVTKGVLRASERRGGIDALTTGGAMQKAAFFLLLCLILYVSVSGAS